MILFRLRSPGLLLRGIGMAALLSGVAPAVEALHRAPDTPIFRGFDLVAPCAGTLAGLVAAISLLVYLRRHQRRESHRW